MSPSVRPSVSASLWKQEVNQRVAAHQNRRGPVAVPAAAPPKPSAASSRAAQAAARVAARFAQAPSYSQMQAAETGTMLQDARKLKNSDPAGRAPVAEPMAELAMQQAMPANPSSENSGPARSHVATSGAVAAATKTKPATRTTVAATRTAPAMKPAAAGFLPRQTELLWGAMPVQSEAPLAAPILVPVQPTAPASLEAWESEHSDHRPESGFALRPVAAAPVRASVRAAKRATPTVAVPVPDVVTATKAASAGAELERNESLVGEAWRSASDEIATVEPDLPLQANLIEFPRELVAARKMRPQMEEASRDAQDTSPQLISFAVDPGTSSLATEEVAPAWPDPETSAPEWSGIVLEDQSLEREEAEEAASGTSELPLASLDRRLMAVLVDGALIVAAFLAGAVVAASFLSHPVSMRFAELGAGAALLLTGLLYQMLFLSLGEATPGMRYAHISLCTFDGMRLTQAQLWGRLRALLLSVLPMGLGIAWILFDEDRLSWHDRLSKSYPRPY